jgi:transcriptional regulator with XRE-family HTH domain
MDEMTATRKRPASRAGVVRDLACAVGYSKSHMSRWLRGERVTAETDAKVEQVLGLRADFVRRVLTGPAAG